MGAAFLALARSGTSFECLLKVYEASARFKDVYKRQLLLDRLDRVAARAARAVMAALRFYGKMSLEFYCVQEAIFIALMHGEFSAPFRERFPIYLPCFVLSTLVAMLLHWACRRIAALSSSGK